MKLFISYARVDKQACIQVAEILDIHDVWYDQRLYAGQHWWQEILNRLDWCEGFVYLLSPDSVNSTYCQKEFEIARKTNKMIFPVIIVEGTQVPPNLEEIQYLNMIKGPQDAEAVQELMKAVWLGERTLDSGILQVPVEKLPQEEQELEPEDDMTPVRMIGQAADAMETGDFDEAVRLLEQAKHRGYESRFIDIDALLHEAESSLQRQVAKRTIDLEYRKIVEVVMRSATRKLGCDAFMQFYNENPTYDPENLMEICKRKRVTKPELIKVVTAMSEDPLPPKVEPPPAELPHLEWCFIPNGLVINDGQSARVADFYMSKYPVTNALYQEFVRDKNGYRNADWWRFSNYAYNWYKRNPEPRPPRYKGDDRPRENVTWYDAMAFCKWLSARLNKTIALPTRQQWQRAAQGEDSRLYPWGDEFDKEKCNTRESRIRMTTVVMRYTEGVSPFGVMDMAGNVWEWCLDPLGGSPEDIGVNAPRSLQGGSFITSYHRAQATFSFQLDPEYYYGTIGFRVVRLD